MFCSYCGEKLKQEAKFCTHCGREVLPEHTQPIESQDQLQMPHTPVQQTPAPVESTKNMNPKGKYLLCGVCGVVAGAILMVVILLLTGVFRTTDASGKVYVPDTENIYITDRDTIEGPGFDTPEEAAEAYLMALKAQDMDTMISTFAIESYVGNYNLEAQVERLGIYMFNKVMPFPATNAYTRRMNIAYRCNQITNQIMYQYMFFNTPDAFNNGEIITLKDHKEVSDFVKKFERDTMGYIFEDLNIVGSIKPEDMVEIYRSENNQKAIANYARIFGADIGDVTDVVIKFKADGESWVFCPGTVRYNGKWYLESLQGNVANLMGSTYHAGGLMRVSSLD